jgi:hypothetical protein
MTEGLNMEAAVHLIFILIKSSILSVVYSGILIILLKMIKYRVYFFRIWLSVFTLLIVYSFTYWGDHGLGDEKRLPLGNGATLIEINEEAQLIGYTDSEQQDIFLSRFDVVDDILYGELDQNCSVFVYKSRYVTVDLRSNELSEYIDRTDFLRNSNHNFQFQSFRESYKEFYGGWRFWLLP